MEAGLDTVRGLEQTEALRVILTARRFRRIDADTYRKGDVVVWITDPCGDVKVAELNGNLIAWEARFTGATHDLIMHLITKVQP